MDIYSEILSALETEDRIMLATIISTSGSTPAAALSKMLVKNNGIVTVGTVGGGCMEGDVVLHANRLYDSGKAEILKFHLNEDDLEHGLICGGTLEVLIEPVSKKSVPMLKYLISIRNDGDDCVLVSRLSRDGTMKEKHLITGRDTNSLNNQSNISHIPHPIPDLENVVKKAFHRQETQRIKTSDGEVIVELVPGTPGLVVFGGGHVSKFISRSATMSGFRTTIVDDREKYSNPKRFPEAVKTLTVDFMEAFANLRIKQSDYIIIVTRGHRFDEDILEQALKTPAKYIGMIGSKRKILTTYEHLTGRGVSIESLRRVRAPMGIEIGALTAEEIAISVVAQLIHTRRGEEIPLHDKSDSLLDALATLERNQIIHT